MSLSKRSFAVFAREVLLFGTNFVTSLIIAHVLGPYYAGLWIILGIIPSYAEVLGRIKVDAASIFYLGKGLYQLSDVVFMLNLIAILSSLFILLPIVCFFDAFRLFLFGETAAVSNGQIGIMLLQIPINFLYLNYTYMHVYKEDVISLNAMVVTRALVSSTLIIISLLGFHWTLYGVVVGSTLGLLSALLVGIFRLGKIPKPSVRFNRTLFNDLLKYGFQLYVGSLISHLNVYVSQAMIIAYCQPAAVAFFSIAQQIAQLFNKVTESMTAFLLPSLSKDQPLNTAAMLAAKAFRVALVVLIPAASLSFICIRPAILCLYGQAYAPVLGPFYIILPGIILAAASSLLMIFFQGIGLAKLITKITIIPFCLQFVMAWWLVPRLGIMGGAWALLITLTLTALVQMIIFLHITRLSKRSLLICQDDIRLLSDFILGYIKRRHRIGLSRSS